MQRMILPLEAIACQEEKVGGYLLPRYYWEQAGADAWWGMTDLQRNFLVETCLHCYHVTAYIGAASQWRAIGECMGHRAIRTDYPVTNKEHYLAQLEHSHDVCFWRFRMVSVVSVL